ncbi:ABC transporter substrate-binding protein [Pseudovibrio japonicus]|uniref:ABC transporter substrate-binding protein n=1 Tax=Pseudovibrio japonicus TaxID=366534 RepID=A0ABQ3DVW1_9HYPH|nr:ABC transporter substrate-binding protein [Pseudovibrio japonicus]
MMFLRLDIFALMLATSVQFALPAAADDELLWQHGLSMYGEPALPEDFTHLPYANPDAPKGGRLTLGVQGTFDSLNQFALKGAFTSTRGMQERVMGSNIFESLLLQSSDEPWSVYAHLAEAVRMPEERDWIEFRLNPAAKFSDGTPLTIDDVIFSIEIIRDKGRLPYSEWYGKVTQFEKTGERSVKFHFADGSDRKLPFLIATAPIFSKAATDVETFGQSTLVPPVASGPYTFSVIEPGRRVIYKKNPDYWGEDLPVKVGFSNFDEVVIDYYRDHNALVEAFKKGDVDALAFDNPTQWETGFDFPAFNEGKVVKETFEKNTPVSMVGIAFNTRQPQFQDKRVRKALGTLLDFNFINRNIFRGQYVRTAGYWDNSDLSSIGNPASEKELELLKPFSGVVEEDVLNGTWRPAETDGSGRNRDNLVTALQLLNEAGYELDGNKLINQQTGEQLSFELMVRSQNEERVALALQRSMNLIGIEMTIRIVDAAQFEERRFNFDFDTLFNGWGAGLTPGAEQTSRWSSAAADIKESRNIVGAKEPAIDSLIATIIAARTREDLITAVRAYDRVLISGFYVIPLYHAPTQQLAYWTRVRRPDAIPLFGYQFDNWWAVD